MHLKAQASLEFLLTLAAFLALLGVWLVAVQKVRGDAESALDREFALLSLSDLAGAADEVCQAGEGSERTVVVRLRSPATLESTGNFISLSSTRNNSLPAFQLVKCGFSVDGSSIFVDYSAQVRVKNEQGTAVYRKA